MRSWGGALAAATLAVSSACQVSGARHCVADAECEGGATCIGGFCTAACVPLAVCPSEVRCSEVDAGCGRSLWCDGCGYGFECGASTRACGPRFVSLSLNVAPRLATRSVPLSAQLTLTDGGPALDPLGLPFQSSDGTGVGPGGTLTLADAGWYVGTFDAPRDGRWSLTADFVDAGLHGMAVVEVDTTPPRLSVVFSPPPSRQVTATFTELDAADQTEGVLPYRRDETATVVVSSPDLDVADASLMLTVGGQAVTLQPGCDAGPFCRSGTFAFGQPPMNAYRARFAAIAHVADDLGNAADFDAGQLPVTRFVWSGSYGSNGGGSFPPAVGPLGTAWVTHDAGHVAVGHRGALLDSSSGRGAAAVMVSERARTATIAINLGSSTRYQDYSAISQAADTPCDLPGVLGGQPVFVDSRLINEPAASDQLIGPAFGWLHRLRPGGFCNADAGFDVGDLAAKGPTAYMSRADDVNAFAESFTGFNQVNGWPRAPGLQPHSPVVVGDNLYYLATVSGFPPSMRVEAQPVGPIASGGWERSYSVLPYAGEDLTATGDGVVYVAHGGLCRYGEQVSMTETCVPVEAVAAPTIGKDGTLYVPTADAGIVALDGTSRGLLWSGLERLPPIRGLAIDCLRDANGMPAGGYGGRLVGVSASRTQVEVFSLVVDSKGLATAGWPKWQHDNRNTGNAATSLSACP